MHINRHFLDPLDKIQRVEVSPYLITRINQRIRNFQNQVVPVRVMWAVGLSFVLLMCINIVAISSTNVQNDSTLTEWAQQMNLNNSNSLY